VEPGSIVIAGIVVPDASPSSRFWPCTCLPSRHSHLQRERAVRSANAGREPVVTVAASYVVMLIAFYVDNGPNLPVWRDLPPIAYWLIPIAAGIALTAWVLRTHRLLQTARRVPPAPP